MQRGLGLLHRVEHPWSEWGGGRHDTSRRALLEDGKATPRFRKRAEELLERHARACRELASMNRPFLDGNERTGAAAAELFLNLDDVELAAGDDDLGEVTLAVAGGEVAAEALTTWLRQRTRRGER